MTTHLVSTSPDKAQDSDRIETLKAEYLAEFKRSFPRLKELAIAVRDEDLKLTNDSENRKFWEITDDPETNLALCQLAHDLDDRLYENLPFTNETETQEGDRLTLEKAINLLDELPKAEKIRVYEYLLTDLYGKYNLPFEVINATFQYTQKFKEFFPKLKELAIKAYHNPLLITG